MDYHALNQQLAQILSQFDLNQSLGGGSLAIYHQGNLVTALTHGSAQIDKANRCSDTLDATYLVIELFNR